MTILAGALALAAVTSAHAQCKTKLAVEGIWNRQTAPGHFEYDMQIRNVTKKPLSYQIDFKNLPSGVNIQPTIKSASPLAPGAALPIRLGFGTNSAFNSNTVSVGFDTPGSAITFSKCM
jgi:hypothetical protein